MTGDNVWLGIHFAATALDAWKRMEHCWTSLHDITYLLEHVISITFYLTSITHTEYCFINSGYCSDDRVEDIMRVQ